MGDRGTVVGVPDDDLRTLDPFLPVRMDKDGCPRDFRRSLLKALSPLILLAECAE